MRTSTLMFIAALALGVLATSIHAECDDAAYLNGKNVCCPANMNCTKAVINPSGVCMCTGCDMACIIEDKIDNNSYGTVTVPPSAALNKQVVIPTVASLALAAVLAYFV